MSSHSNPYNNLSETEIRRWRQQLEEEITWLDRHMQANGTEGGEPDMALVRTYREMIFSRRALLGRLPR